ncbi:hypothetical protein NM208_g12428 [Fusarium decemcellulare]|uniref:Uncharacterized protein n=1 Tax=Fusarium decemcellulare TaxID=57161 RepID=A0ACC1RQP9_9HYPO|nr:hypothetical protein NM208_g12428 [Fusarium decemcellulare]
MQLFQLHCGLILSVLCLVSSVQSVEVYGNGVKYLGIQNVTSGVNTFFGIRYAQAPVGKLRWRAPVPIKRRRGAEKVIDATVAGPACLQSTAGWRVDSDFPIPQGEDCLSLTIQTPSEPASDKLPVMVLIHGGGYLAGSSVYTSGDSLVHQSNGGMVFVSIQYRLGALGFLGGDEIKKDGTWNAGLLDQRAALEWIRKNIHYFGGDPSKVTITGSSAGGGSVAMQMIMFGGKPKNPPFQAAIPEFPWWTPTYDDEWVQGQYDGFLKAANCSSLKCLRKLPLSAIRTASRAATVAAYLDKQYAYGTFYWGPTIDGKIIQRGLHEEFEDGHFTKVPILVDRNFDEGFIFSNTSLASDEEALADLSALWHRDSLFVEEVWEQYPESTYNISHLDDLPSYQLQKNSGFYNGTITNSFIRRSAIFGDALVACPTTFISEAVTKAGLSAYKLIFNSGFQFHSATIYYAFSNYTDVDGSRFVNGASIPGNATLATLLRNYLISFTLFHDPNTLKPDYGVFPSWPEYTTHDPKVMYLADSGVEVVADPEGSGKCDIFADGAWD